MRQYSSSEKLEIKQELKKIICNRCGKEMAVTANGYLTEDYLSVEKQWGYFSKKDNRMDRFDLCEDCYDEIVASFLIPLRE